MLILRHSHHFCFGCTVPAKEKETNSKVKKKKQRRRNRLSPESEVLEIYVTLLSAVLESLQASTWFK